MNLMKETMLVRDIKINNHHTAALIITACDENYINEELVESLSLQKAALKQFKQK